MKEEILSAVGAGKAYHLEAIEALQQAIDAAALVESLPEKEKAIAQLEQRLEDITQACVRKQSDRNVIEAEIEDRAKKLAAFESTYGKSVRLQELDVKIERDWPSRG